MANPTAVEKCIDAYSGAVAEVVQWSETNCSQLLEVLDKIDGNVEDYNQLVELYNKQATELIAGEFRAVSSRQGALPTFALSHGSQPIADMAAALKSYPDSDQEAFKDVEAAVAAGTIIWRDTSAQSALNSELKNNIIDLKALQASQERASNAFENRTDDKDGSIFQTGIGPEEVLRHWGNFLKDDEEIKADAIKRRKARVQAEAIADGDLAAAACLQSVSYERLTFKEQCFLLAKIFAIADYKKNVLEGDVESGFQPKRLPYLTEGNASVQVEGDPFGFLNSLTQNSNLSALFDMETKEISSLQPKIRLYKVIEDEEGNEQQQEFMFDAYASGADIESIFKDKARRGFGAGIKKFSFTYDGNNPFAAKKSIKAKLHIFANNFSELLMDRGGYMYSDLALKTGSNGKKLESCEAEETPTEAILNKLNDAEYKLNFRLKAVVGWAYPTGDTSLFTTKSASDQKTVLDALSESFVTLNLTPTIHEFDIDEQGRVNFVINYLAYIDDFFDQPHFNIFYDADVSKAMMQRKLAYEALRAECSSAEIAKLKKSDAEGGRITQEKNDSMKSLLRRMRDRGKIRYISLTYEQLKLFQTQGPFFEDTERVTIGNASDVAGSATEETREAYTSQILQGVKSEGTRTKLAQQLAIALEANDPSVEHIGFFYVSDLMDVILESIEEYLTDYSLDGPVWEDLRNATEGTDPTLPIEKISDCQYDTEGLSISRFYTNFKKFRLVLGPMEIVDPTGQQDAQFISLGDIPISVKYFVEWLNAKMTKQEESTYFLSRFVIDFFNHLINNFLNDDNCFSYNTKQKINLNQSVVTSYKESSHTNIDELTGFIFNQGADAWAQGSAWWPGRATVKDLTEGGPILNISGPPTSRLVEAPVSEEINHFIFSAGRTRPAGAMEGVRLQDEEAGIFHYMLGRPRGIVKNIRLVKAEVPYLKEVRFEQDGYDGLQQLREQYNIEVDCYANVRTFPGTYIFVDPRGWSPESTLQAGHLKNLTEYGIGGYCMIYRSEHSFGPGEASTRLFTQWVQEINTGEENVRKRSSSGDGSDSNSACQAILDTRAETPAAPPDTVSLSPQVQPQSTANPIGRAPNANFGIGGDVGISKL